MIRWVWLTPFLVLLYGCSGVAVKEGVGSNTSAYQERSQKLGAMTDWSLAGRISLDDGNQGGSGKLQWRVEGDNSELDFHAAMGRGAWHLQIDPEGALLREANGTEQTAAGVNALIQQRMGWPIPVDALQWWVRGLAAPGDVEELNIDTQGLLSSLVQFGWQVDFNRYDSVTGMALPVRLDARRQNYRVKLAISRWRLGGGHATAN